MATFTHGKSAVFKITDAGAALRDLSGVVKTTSFKQTVDMAEVSALGTNSKAFIGGLADATFNVDGFGTVTEQGYLSGILGLAKAWEFYPQGVGSGLVKYTGSGLLKTLETDADVGGALAMKGEIQVTGDVTRAVQ